VRQHGRDREQAERRECGLFRNELQYVPETPERIGALRIDQQNIQVLPPRDRLDSTAQPNIKRSLDFVIGGKGLLPAAIKLR